MKPYQHIERRFPMPQKPPSWPLLANLWCSRVEYSYLCRLYQLNVCFAVCLFVCLFWSCLRHEEVPRAGINWSCGTAATLSHWATRELQSCLFFFFSFSHRCGTWKFLGEGLNLSSSFGSCGNVRSLTCCNTAGTPCLFLNIFQKVHSSKKEHN